MEIRTRSTHDERMKRDAGGRVREEVHGGRGGAEAAARC